MTTALAANAAWSEPQQAIRAARTVGWTGEVRGPVDFGGVRFYAVLGHRVRFDAPGSDWLLGCVVVCRNPFEGLTDASLLAAYSRRLIAVDVAPGLDLDTALQVDMHRRRAELFTAADVRLQASLLDQGVVIHERLDATGVTDIAALEVADRWSVLSWPGEVVASPLQRDQRWGRDSRWRRFYTAVTTAPVQSPARSAIGPSIDDTTRGLVDARALWWRDADTCTHDTGPAEPASLDQPEESGESGESGELDGCGCCPQGYWSFGPDVFGMTVEIDGVWYVTDRRLLIRRDRLANLPDYTGHQDDHGSSADGPYLSDLVTMPAAATRCAELLGLPDSDEPVVDQFDPQLLDPLTAAGYSVRRTTDPGGCHAVLDPTGVRVGVVMPLTEASDAGAVG